MEWIGTVAKTEALTWFIMVVSFDPSRMFFSRMFSSFTSLSEGICNRIAQSVI